MKKTIPNPEYEKAKYTGGWITDGKLANPSNARFKVPLPIGKWFSQQEMDEWIKANAIYPTIEVDE